LIVHGEYIHVVLCFSEEVIKTKRDTNNTVPTEQCTPPDHVFPSKEQPLSTEALFPKSVVPKVKISLFLLKYQRT
jgi:hypothetical protein